MQSFYLAWFETSSLPSMSGIAPFRRVWERLGYKSLENLAFLHLKYRKWCCPTREPRKNLSDIFHSEKARHFRNAGLFIRQLNFTRLLTPRFVLFGIGIGIKKVACDNGGLNLLPFISPGTEATRDRTYQFFRPVATVIRTGFTKPSFVTFRLMMNGWVVSVRHRCLTDLHLQ